MNIGRRVKMVAKSGVGLVALGSVLFLGYAHSLHAAPASSNPYVLSSTYLSSHHVSAKYVDPGPQGAAKGQVGKVNHGHPTSNGIPGIQGISNWDGTWNEFGYDPNGNPTNTWYYNTIGNPPQDGKTTTFDAPIIPVKVVLLDQNNNVAFTMDPEHDVQPVVNSPIFQDTKYSSSDKPTQFTDAVQRAEFYHVMKNSWHTLLVPSVEPEVTMTVPYGKYYVGLYSDGTVAFALVDFYTFLNLLYPATVAQQSSTIVGQEELNGTSTTQNISTYLFDNTFEYNGTLADCCIQGFHDPDVEPGDASNGNLLRNYATIVASWITPGLYPPGLQDIIALSHEMAETFNDPFSGAYFPYDTTPWWLSSDTSTQFGTFAICQDYLEVGDVVEVYNVTENTSYPITIDGFTYHPQTEALLPWFQGQSPSSAFDGAYSYPDESILSSPAVSMQPNCIGPA